MKPKTNSWLRLAVLVAIFFIAVPLVGNKPFEFFIESFSKKGFEFVAGVLGLGLVIIFGIAAIRWAQSPLRKAKKSETTRVIAVIVIGAFTALSFQATSAEVVYQEVVVSNSPQPTQTAVIDTTADLPELHVFDAKTADPVVAKAVESALAAGETYVLMKAQADCAVGYIIVIVVIGGIIYVGYKLYKACQAVSKRRNKKIDDEDSDGSGSNTNRQKSAVFRSALPEGAQMYCASFIVPEFSTAQDTSAVDGLTALSLTYPVTETNALVSAAVPTRTVDIETYLAERGLSTNMFDQASYSSNGVACGPFSIITFNPTTKAIGINLPGYPNTVTHTLQTSPDMVSWTNCSSITAPVGARMKFSPSPTSMAPQFWRLVK